MTGGAGHSSEAARLREAEANANTDADTAGAIGMARYWMRFPEHAEDASRDCLRRELLTISRALVRLANRQEAK